MAQSKEISLEKLLELHNTISFLNLIGTEENNKDIVVLGANSEVLEFETEQVSLLMEMNRKRDSIINQLMESNADQVPDFMALINQWFEENSPFDDLHYIVTNIHKNDELSLGSSDDVHEKPDEDFYVEGFDQFIAELNEKYGRTFSIPGYYYPK